MLNFILDKIYFTCLELINKNTTGRYCFFYFHIMGTIAFIKSTIKHIKRKNYTHLPSQIKGILWQLKLVLKSLTAN